MKHYMLDTNILSAIVRDPDGKVAKRFERLAPDQVSISIVVSSEARFGAAYNPGARSSGPMMTLVESIRATPFEPPADQIYATVRADLARKGWGLSPNDYLIVAHAMAIDAILITDDRRILEAGITGLKVEDWLRDAPAAHE